MKSEYKVRVRVPDQDTVDPVPAQRDLRERFYPEFRFGGFTELDGTVKFYVRVRALVQQDDYVLDVGCGRGEYQSYPDYVRDLRVFQGHVRRVIGIDVDANAQSNPFMDEFRRIETAQWPVEDAAVDLIVSDWTLEHIEDPQAFFAECRRVLVPGGYVCIRTTNQMGYVGLLSRLIPNAMHKKVLKKAQRDRESIDVFPTVYRCNTVGKLRRALEAAGFDSCVYGYEAEPSYLGFSPIAYGLGVIYQKFVPRAFGNALFAFGRKRKSP